MVLAVPAATYRSLDKLPIDLYLITRNVVELLTLIGDMLYSSHPEPETKVSTGWNLSRATRELLPNVGTARMLIVREVIGGSRTVNVTEQVDTVRPTGLTMREVSEHGGHEIGTVGRIVTDTDEVVSWISSLPLYQWFCNKDIRILTTYNTLMYASSERIAHCTFVNNFDKCWLFSVVYTHYTAGEMSS